MKEKTGVHTPVDRSEGHEPTVLNAAERKTFVDRVVRDVSELGDRTSPEDQPDMMLVTSDELADIVETALVHYGLGLPVSSWLPIETAPRDGTIILVYRPDKSVRLAQWRKGWQDWHTVPGAYNSEATHWQPLPDAPVGSAPPSDEGGSTDK